MEFPVGRYDLAFLVRILHIHHQKVTAMANPSNKVEFLGDKSRASEGLSEGRDPKERSEIETKRIHSTSKDK